MRMQSLLIELLKASCNNVSGSEVLIGMLQTPAHSRAHGCRSSIFTEPEGTRPVPVDFLIGRADENFPFQYENEEQMPLQFGDWDKSWEVGPAVLVSPSLCLCLCLSLVSQYEISILPSSSPFLPFLLPLSLCVFRYERMRRYAYVCVCFLYPSVCCSWPAFERMLRGVDYLPLLAVCRSSR